MTDPHELIPLVVAALNADAPLAAQVVGGWHEGVAPLNTAAPWGVVTLVSAPAESKTMVEATGASASLPVTGLPSGLSISSSGQISGTPTSAGTSSVMVLPAAV